MNLPEGYTSHEGNGCPVDPDTYVDLIVRTGDGLGHSDAMKAKMHDWQQDAEGGLGHVVGYRIAQRGEDINTYKRWPEAAVKKEY